MTKEENEKIKVVSADIIVTGLKHNPNKPYYQIKYLEVGNNDYTIGYGSYNLDFVIEWLNTCFEIVGEECTVSCDYEQLYVDSIKLINKLQDENQDLKTINNVNESAIKIYQRKIEKQKAVLDILSKYIRVFKFYDDCFIVINMVNFEKYFEGKITKEQYDILKEWKND